MSGPYTFNIDKSDDTWACENDQGVEVATGDLPLTDTDRLEAIFDDLGVSSPVSNALLDFYKRNWTETET
jgi:hypothetical protein